MKLRALITLTLCSCAPVAPMVNEEPAVDAGTVVVVDAGTIVTVPDAGYPVDAGVFIPQDAGTLQPSVTCGPKTDAFYTVDPSRLNVPDGTVLDCESIDGMTPLQPGHAAYRVTYKSTALVHADGGTFEVAVPLSGQVYVPVTTATSPRLVLANTHGATGIIATCAPSKTASFDATVMLNTLKAVAPDAVVVVPDYLGLGVDHGYRVPDSNAHVADTFAPWSQVSPLDNVTHDAFSIEGEGRATIDLVRAARVIPNTNIGANPKWMVLGVSQGGHAALATGETWSRGYGHDTELKGVVAGAPTSMFEDRSFIIDDVERIVLPMIVAGLSMEFRDLQTSKYFSNQSLSAMSKTSNVGCMGSFATWALTTNTYLTGATLTKGDPMADPALRFALHANSPGFEPTSVPVFIGQVDGDPAVDARRTAMLVGLERQTNPGLIHSCLYPGVNQSAAWVQRIENHDAFRFMFGGGEAICVGRDGQPTGDDVLAFIASCVH